MIVSPAEAKDKYYGWKGTASVEEWLYAEPWEFEFFQAVRILEAISPDRLPPGEAAEPDDEAVRMSSRIGLDYSPSEVQAVTPSRRPGVPPALVTNLFSMGGPTGPLPYPDTETLLDRMWHGDAAFRDFLDMFHHRLLSLLVRARKLYDPGFTTVRPDRGPMAEFLYSLMGMAGDLMKNRLQVDDRRLLFYAGILVQQPRPASGLERMLADQFRTPVRVEQMVGMWRALDPEVCTVIGPHGRNARLGGGAVLGGRIWDQQGRFDVHLGPMGQHQFMELLPVGGSYRALCEMTRFYAPTTLEFGFRLTLKAADVPGTILGKRSWLGWTTWVLTRAATADDSQVYLHSRPAGKEVS
jgi:type VI secretion system protein ImpH